MLQCHSCGASIDTHAPACPYCGVQTAAGAHAAHAHQQHNAYLEQQSRAAELDREAARHAEAQASIKRTGNHSLWWSVAGLIFCCPPVPSVVGLVMALRARKMGTKYQLVVPATATAGLILSALGVLFGGGMLVWFLVADAAHGNRVSDLRRAVDGPSKQAHLTHDVACQLAELNLLEDGFAGNAGINIEDVDCAGKLSESGETATLDALTFKGGSSARVAARACFERGAKWRVTGFRRQARCDEPDDTSIVASASAEPETGKQGKPRKGKKKSKSKRKKKSDKGQGDRD